MSFRGSDQPLPGSPLDVLFMKFATWNGDPPAPKISHWTSQGTIAIVGSIPWKSTAVLWNGQHIGYDGHHPMFAFYNLIDGKYDRDFGFAISELIPADLADWNNL